MKKYSNIKINEDIAYFIGVLHSDGCIYRFKDPKEDFVRIRLNLSVAKKSLPMAQKFQEILLQYFNRNVNLRKRPNKNLYVLQTEIKRLYHIFKGWDKSKIPEEVMKIDYLFGAYLAGLIDGDGHLKLKNNKDRRIKQLVIIICGPKRLVKVKEYLEKYSKGKVHFVKYKNRNCFDTCFYVTYKNLGFLERHVFPYIKLTYKKERFDNYAKKIRRAYRDSKFSAAREFLQHP